MSFLCIVICFTAILALVQYSVYRELDPECLVVNDYHQSKQRASKIYNAIQQVYLLGNDNIQQDALQDVDYLYYITDGTNEYSNTGHSDRAFYEQHQNNFYAYENGNWEYGKETDHMKGMIPLYNVYYTIYIAYPDDAMNHLQDEWTQMEATLIYIIIAIAVLSILGILCLIHVIYAAGKRSDDDEIHLAPMDRIDSDVLVLAVFVITLLWVQSIKVMPDFGYINGMKWNVSRGQYYEIIWVAFFTAVTLIALGSIFFSLIRKGKAGVLIRGSLIYKVGSRLVKAFSNLYKNLFDISMFRNMPLTKSLFLRQLIFIASSFLLVLLTLGFFLIQTMVFILPIAIEGYIIYWFIRGNNLIYEDLNKDFQASIDEQMKAERMKVALITNVSHDLKTPLTSIISYTDLLSKEELSDVAKDYIKILQDKSYLLKNIVTDLFELAKSTSGDINLEMEELDIKKLLEQTLGDMEDHIKLSQLSIKVSLPEQPVMIYSDGKKLYRVFQNILDNALKYSMQGTRVYIHLVIKDGHAIVTIKNVASYEMNFTKEEILQRFTRGDESRTTEGSGLGLSIAKSFTNVCGGEFDLSIDGDLFKVRIQFPIQKKAHI